MHDRVEPCQVLCFRWSLPPPQPPFCCIVLKGGNRAAGSSPDGTGSDSGSQSDAYVFSPQGPATSIVGREDTGFWPSSLPSPYAPKPKPNASVVFISGPVMTELSTVHTLRVKDRDATPAFAAGVRRPPQLPVRGVGGGGWGGVAFWQASRLYQFERSAVNDGGVAMEGVETAYLVDPLSSNTDLVARYTTGQCTSSMLYSDAAGWTTTATARKQDFFDLQGKIGCNYVPSSTFGEIRGSMGTFSLAAIGDRARGVASLADGELEVVLHRHANGGNGRGPTDDDNDGVLGAITLLPAASHKAMLIAKALRPELALRRSHPVAVLYRQPTAPHGSAHQDEAGEGDGTASPRRPQARQSPQPRARLQAQMVGEWSPLTLPLPANVHLLSFQRRSFLKAGSHVPDYPGGNPMQGVLRLQNVYDAADSGSVAGSVDVRTLFNAAAFNFKGASMCERTLSLAQPSAGVKRRSWHGVGMAGATVTSANWTHGGAPQGADALQHGRNSSVVSLGPTQIRSFTFDV